MFFGTLDAQDIIKDPKFPKGVNSKNQYEAIPHYNEAVELYKKGEVERAKKSLLEAINVSFALVEAQLFLGTIYHEQGRVDSALIYLNSGIDFEINQPAHYYFRLFETGMKLELYDVLKHNLKHFKKYYGNVDHGKYDSIYPYTVSDYEFYLNSVSLATDYNYWRSKAVEVKTIELNSESAIVPNENGVGLVNEQNQYFLKAQKLKKQKFTLKKTTSFNKEEWVSNGLFFKTINKQGIYTSYWKQGEKDKWTAFPEELNDGSWNGHFFYSPQNKLIYFSSSRKGNKDLYVMRFNPSKSSFSNLTALDRVNTTQDELYPTFVNEIFYFSSNGLPGFGGFDIYYSPDYSIENKIVKPSKWYNMGKPYNTGDDEIQFVTYNNLHFVSKTNWNDENYIKVFEPKTPKSDFDYEIKLTKFVDEE